MILKLINCWSNPVGPMCDFPTSLAMLAQHRGCCAQRIAKGDILASLFPARSVLWAILSHGHINISTITKKLAAKVQENSPLSARHRFTCNPWKGPCGTDSCSQWERARKYRDSYGCWIKQKQLCHNFRNSKCKINMVGLGRTSPWVIHNSEGMRFM